MTAKSSALAVLKRLHICYYITCMTVPLMLVPSSSVSMERLKDKKYVRK